MRDIRHYFPVNTRIDSKTVNPLVGGSNPSRGAIFPSKTLPKFGPEKAGFQVFS